MDPLEQTPLMCAARNGSGPMVTLLLDKGADSGLRDHKGRNAISFAVQSGDEDSIRGLLSRGADPQPELLKE